MFRLVLDIELGEDQELAIKEAKFITEELRKLGSTMPNGNINGMKLKLQRDEDRRPKNYMTIDENGHASGKKQWLYPEGVEGLNIKEDEL